MSAAPEDLSRICASCGLCCNGTIFGFVDLHDHEVAAAERNRLPLVQPVVPGSAHFALPCPRHVDGTGCSIYDERPGACRRYVCRLLEDVSAGSATVDRQLRRAARIRELQAKLKGRGVELRDVMRVGLARAREGAALSPNAAELLLDLVEVQIILKKDYGAIE
jgi:hypothetical protein